MCQAGGVGVSTNRLYPNSFPIHERFIMKKLLLSVALALMLVGTAMAQTMCQPGCGEPGQIDFGGAVITIVGGVDANHFGDDTAKAGRRRRQWSCSTSVGLSSCTGLVSTSPWLSHDCEATTSFTETGVTSISLWRFRHAGTLE